MDDQTPVNYNAMLKKYGFRKDGAAHWESLMSSPENAMRAWLIKNQVVKATADKFPKYNDMNNNEADAFRHALWSYRVTKVMGEQIAKDFGDAHERQNIKIQGSQKGSVLMDLDNNGIGRFLATDPNNRNRKDIDVIEEALRNGKLRTKPYKIEKETEIPSGILDKRIGITAIRQAYRGNP